MGVGAGTSASQLVVAGPEGREEGAELEDNFVRRSLTQGRPAAQPAVLLGQPSEPDLRYFSLIRTRVRPF